MKRAILFGIVGIATAMAASSYGQGFIQLQNYQSSAGVPPVMWGPGSGGTVGNAIDASGYTVGLYFATGNQLANVIADSSAGTGTDWGTADPISLYSGFGLASGAGSTAGIADSSVFGYAGAYQAGNNFQPNAGAGATITVMLVAYNGASYDASTIRGHSLAFTMTTSTGTGFAPTTGAAETDGGFQVMLVPEPTTMALGGLGLAAFAFFRRKKA